MKKHADLLIVGGGLSGLTLAVAAAHHGLSAQVFDAGANSKTSNRGGRPLDFDGRAYALAYTSVNLLKMIGLWDDIARESQEISEIKVSHGRAGDGAYHGVLHFHGLDLDEAPPGHMVEERILRRALQTKLVSLSNVEILREDPVTAHEVMEKGAVVTLASGKRFMGDVIIACDGRLSKTARRAGIRHFQRAYGQYGMVCAVEHEKDHHGIAHQYFAPDGPLAILPLAGGRRSSIVWTANEERARKLEAASDEAYLRALRPLFGDFLGQIAIAGARYAYPLELSLAYEFSAKRVVVLGDAAHAIHPLAGQGLNLGFRDIAALVELLISAKRRGEDLGASSLLSAYAQWRRPDALALALTTDNVNRLFSNYSQMLALFRGIGMQAINGSPGLRRIFMRRAMGLMAHNPRLLDGMPL